MLSDRKTERKETFAKAKATVIKMNVKKPKKINGSCESCEFYDYDEYYEEYYCKVDIDQDERERYIMGTNDSCPYYRFYDEYKSVQKQN